MPRNLTIVLACLLAVFAFLAWWKAWVTFGILAFLIGLVVLWGWYRHKLELEGQQLLRTMAFAYRVIAEEEEKKRNEESRLPDKG